MRSDRITVLVDAGRALSSSLDYDQTLKAVADQVVPRVADWCSIELLDGDHLRAVALAHADADLLAVARAFRDRRVPRPEQQAGLYHVIRTGQSELYAEITDAMLAPVRAEDPDVGALLDRIQLGSALLVPIKARGSTLGALALYMGASGRRFGPDDVPFAEELADRAGLAIDNARLYRESVAARTAAERAADRARRLHRLSQALGATTTVAEVAAVVVADGLDALGAAAGFVWMKTEDGTALEMIADAGHSTATVEAHRRVPFDAELPLVHAIETGELVMIGTRAELATYPAAAAASTMSPFNAWAAMPFVVAGAAIGGFTVSFAEARVFDDDDRALLDTMMGHASQALARCQLFEAERAARAQAQAADRKKDEFLAMLGHELRNPLAPIVTALDLLRLRGQSDSRELAVIERQTRYLTRLVDDLLDISRITRGKITIVRVPIELARIVARAVETVSPLIEERRHQLVIDVPATGLVVAVDEGRLAQVVANLLNNAAKYTPPGGRIEIRASATGAEVRLAVRDNGAGIPPALLGSVFDLFVQGPQTLARADGGLGLGLALVKSLVELHGGRVGAASDGPGQGSELEIVLPAVGDAPAPEPPASAASAASGEGRGRVLIVDDNEDAADLLGEALARRGYEVKVVYDPVDALEIAPGLDADVAVLDIGLPVMDGYELAGKLRAAGARRPYLIAATGYGQDSDRERAVAAGFDAHVVKPIALQLLLDILAAR